MRHCRHSWTHSLAIMSWSWLVLLPVAALTVTLRAGEPVQPVAFKQAGVVKAWKVYKHKLTFGKGQTLALVDDGCKLSMHAFAPAGSPSIFWRPLPRVGLPRLSVCE